MLRIDGATDVLKSLNAFIGISLLRSLAGRLAHLVGLQNKSNNCRSLLATDG